MHPGVRAEQELQSDAALPSEPLMAFLIPSVGAIVQLPREGRAEVMAAEWSAAFDGSLADDVARLARGEVSPRLAALARTHAAAAELVAWRQHAWVPLTALEAIRLDGFDTLFLELVGTCNERCVHCYADSSPQVKAALDRDVCEKIVDDAHDAGFRRIQLTGGDPLICRFLPELLARAAPLFSTCEIYTNGLLLDDDLLARLAQHRPAFAFSYYSCDPAVHDAITRTPGSHRRTRSAIERTIARGLEVRTSVIVLDQNVETIDATVDELERLGAKPSANSGRSVGRGRAFAWQPRTPSGGNHRGAATSDGKLAVTYDGAVVPCIFNRSRVLGRVDAGVRLRDVLAHLSLAAGPARGAEALSCSSCRTTDFALAALRET